MPCAGAVLFCDDRRGAVKNECEQMRVSMAAAAGTPFARECEPAVEAASRAVAAAESPVALAGATDALLALLRQRPLLRLPSTLEGLLLTAVPRCCALLPEPTASPAARARELLLLSLVSWGQGPALGDGGSVGGGAGGEDSSNSNNSSSSGGSGGGGGSSGRSVAVAASDEHGAGDDDTAAAARAASAAVSRGMALARTLEHFLTATVAAFAACGAGGSRGAPPALAPTATAAAPLDDDAWEDFEPVGAPAPDISPPHAASAAATATAATAATAAAAAAAPEQLAMAMAARALGTLGDAETAMLPFGAAGLIRAADAFAAGPAAAAGGTRGATALDAVAVCSKELQQRLLTLAHAHAHAPLAFRAGAGPAAGAAFFCDYGEEAHALATAAACVHVSDVMGWERGGSTLQLVMGLLFSRRLLLPHALLAPHTPPPPPPPPHTLLPLPWRRRQLLVEHVRGAAFALAPRFAAAVSANFAIAPTEVRAAVLLGWRAFGWECHRLLAADAGSARVVQRMMQGHSGDGGGDGGAASGGEEEEGGPLLGPPLRQLLQAAGLGFLLFTQAALGVAGGVDAEGAACLLDAAAAMHCFLVPLAPADGTYQRVLGALASLAEGGGGAAAAGTPAQESARRALLWQIPGPALLAAPPHDGVHVAASRLLLYLFWAEQWMGSWLLGPTEPPEESALLNGVLLPALLFGAGHPDPALRGVAGRVLLRFSIGRQKLVHSADWMLELDGIPELMQGAGGDGGGGDGGGGGGGGGGGPSSIHFGLHLQLLPRLVRLTLAGVPDGRTSVATVQQLLGALFEALSWGDDPASQAVLLHCVQVATDLAGEWVEEMCGGGGGSGTSAAVTGAQEECARIVLADEDSGLRALFLSAFFLTKASTLRLLPYVLERVRCFVLGLPSGPVREAACSLLFATISDDVDPARKTDLARWYMTVADQAASKL